MSRAQWLSPSDVAERTGKELATVKYWLRQGLPHTRIAGSLAVRILSTDLDEWLRERYALVPTRHLF